MAEEHATGVSRPQSQQQQQQQQQQRPAQAPTDTQGFFNGLFSQLYGSPRSLPQRDSNVGFDASATPSVSSQDGFGGRSSTTTTPSASPTTATPNAPHTAEFNSAPLSLAAVNEKKNRVHNGCRNGSRQKPVMASALDTAAAAAATEANADVAASGQKKAPFSYAAPPRGPDVCAPHMLGYRQCLEVNPDFKTNCTWALDNYMRCKEDMEM